MKPSTASLEVETDEYRRIIGTVDQGHDGPTVVVVGGLHGNEPAGYEAARRVVESFGDGGITLRGRLVAIGGNLNALRQGQRYADRDLNRAWTRRHLEGAGGASAEDREQREILDLLVEHLDRNGHRGVVIDLHSTSAPGPPFAIVGDTLRNRPLAFALGVPVILGLEELIEGTMIEFLVEHGHIAVAIEGGQHDAPETADRLEAAVWLALESCGAVAGADIPGRAQKVSSLHAASHHFPRVVEVRYRHGIRPEGGFVMEPGFVNFDAVRKGQRLARDHGGEVVASEGGCVLLPLYQGKGEDGFFIGRAVKRFWLRLSGLMRRLRIDRVAEILPGVHRDPDHHDHLLADPRVARWLAVQVFHLLGYRREAPVGELLHFSRRRPDHLPTVPLGPSKRR
jgi:succinylglutamate desuccinylase